jgi:hypothetical protein
MKRGRVITVQLTLPQVAHLLHLLHADAEEGSYYGNKEQYYAGTQAIIKVLGQACSK